MLLHTAGVRKELGDNVVRDLDGFQIRITNKGNCRDLANIHTKRVFICKKFPIGTRRRLLDQPCGPQTPNKSSNSTVFFMFLVSKRMFEEAVIKPVAGAASLEGCGSRGAKCKSF